MCTQKEFAQGKLVNLSYSNHEDFGMYCYSRNINKGKDRLLSSNAASFLITHRHHLKDLHTHTHTAGEGLGLGVLENPVFGCEKELSRSGTCETDVQLPCFEIKHRKYKTAESPLKHMH